MSDHVANAYLFSGRAGSFLHVAGRYFAAAVNCQNKTQEGPCCDCTVCRSIEQNTGVHFVEFASEKIGVDAVRQWQELVRYSHENGRLFVSISWAEGFSTEAANAFLKTLEEPPSGVTFILLTRQPWSVLSTIQSRCQHLVFPVLTGTIDKEETLTFPYLSIESLKSMSLLDRLAWVQELAKDKIQAKTVLGLWLDELWKNRGSESYSQAIEQVIENISQMKYNLNLRLHLENLVMRILV